MSAIFLQYVEGFCSGSAGAKREKLRQAGFICLTSRPEVAESEEQPCEIWALFDTHHRDMSHDDLLAWLRRDIRPGKIYDAKTFSLTFE